MVLPVDTDASIAQFTRLLLLLLPMLDSQLTSFMLGTDLLLFNFWRNVELKHYIVTQLIRRTSAKLCSIHYHWKQKNMFWGTVIQGNHWALYVIFKGIFSSKRSITWKKRSSTCVAGRIPPVIPTGRCCKKRYQNLVNLHFNYSWSSVTSFKWPHLDGLSYF